MRTELDDYIATRADVRAYLDRALSDAETHSQQEAALFETVKDKLLQSGARLVAHYYVDSEIQRLAEETESLNADILSINSTLESRNRQADENAEAEEAARREAEQKLNELVEQNPDTTKRVLESWIKDAA